MGKNTEIAIKVENVSKTFHIPHEKISSVRGAFVNVLKKNSYEEFRALDDVSFEVKRGEFFGIIGRNGSGKSTLLKILAGIYEADKGKAEITGLISPFLELGIGFNPELSGRDNIYLNATVLGLTQKQIDEKFDDIVAFSELERFIDQKIKNYSSGMQVRLAFSVAIHANREILLMDEVLAVGDSNFQSKCLEEFNRYKERGKTVILVTHDVGTVQRYCDRAMLIRNGKVEMIGDSEEVGDKYMYQNISDEEKRMKKEHDQEMSRVEKEKNKLMGKESKEEGIKIEEEKEREEGGKNKIAEVTRVEFLDSDGKERNTFETGDDVLIKVFFKKNKEVDVLNFGIGLHSQENICVLGVDTTIDKIATVKNVEDGYFQLYLKNIPLKANSYFINIGIYGKNDKVIYDHILRAKYFKVFSNDKNFGMVNINYTWN